MACSCQCCGQWARVAPHSATGPAKGTACALNPAEGTQRREEERELVDDDRLEEDEDEHNDQHVVEAHENQQRKTGDEHEAGESHLGSNSVCARLLWLNRGSYRDTFVRPLWLNRGSYRDTFVRLLWLQYPSRPNGQTRHQGQYALAEDGQDLHPVQHLEAKRDHEGEQVQHHLVERGQDLHPVQHLVAKQAREEEAR